MDEAETTAVNAAAAFSSPRECSCFAAFTIASAIRLVNVAIVASPPPKLLEEAAA